METETDRTFRGGSTISTEVLRFSERDDGVSGGVRDQQDAGDGFDFMLIT